MNITTITPMNATTIGTVNIKDCGTLQASLYDQISFIFKVSIFIELGLVIMQWWALNKVQNSTESEDRKATLTAIILTFTNGVIILMIFIQLYWIFLSGLDF